MYYVAFLKEPKLNVLIPNTWVLNYEQQMNKDMFFGVNPSQRVLCYYSPAGYDEDGKPKSDFPPNFNLGVNGRFPNEGCYEARLKKFKSK